MSLSALQASAYLHHLSIASPDPGRLAGFYAEAMGMTATSLGEGRWMVSGPGRRLMLSLGDAKSLVSAGFAVRDAEALTGLRARAQERQLAMTDGDTELFRPGAFSVRDPDNNVICFGLAADENKAPMKAIRAPIQHLTLASREIEAIEEFYAGKLGFGVSDRVVDENSKLMTVFMRGNHEHHNLACFFQDRQGVDHHSYEAGEWDTIRDWADHLASKGIPLMWGPGRHGPGNNLFLFIVDPDGNWIEISAELEVVHDRPMKIWPHAERTLNLWGHGKLRA